MPIAIADKVIALLAALSPEDIAALPPAERRRFADWCRRAADLAEPRRSETDESVRTTPKAGVLAQLRERPGRES